jgi:hypothetical protein
VATAKGKQKNMLYTWATDNLREGSSKDYLHRIVNLEQKCGQRMTGLSRAVLTLSVISPCHYSRTISTQDNLLFGKMLGFAAGVNNLAAQ